ncbi:MAG TPA: MarR family transcriptional regulator [Sphingobium sp.]|uniref:MarR family winged helix-turn-helix transcriptional regulator n=1 Tax=unclassified Sphingobium TaxID=2611147 RepID=UPI0007F5378E|nr:MULTISPECIES: MarR family transcriptional regulator [unclassified Sphingobium]OAN51049.1 MarR family transcriptional regulator [Sphingobium sp. TCM1]WIW88182.1 MarR family transcriptional regulator [Sphingobium sp. V4]HAF40363.1 MarR family transcriptional regulator [Sphingobium sp.]
MPLSESKRALAHKMAPVARSWRQLADAALAQFGVSNSAGWCLIHIDRIGPDVRQAELAESLDISQPSLVRTLDQLQAAGLVARTQHPDDKRSNVIALTSAGKELVGQIETKLGALRADLLRDVPDEAIEIMVEMLDLLAHRIAERRSQM